MEALAILLLGFVFAKVLMVVRKNVTGEFGFFAHYCLAVCFGVVLYLLADSDWAGNKNINWISFWLAVCCLSASYGRSS